MAKLVLSSDGAIVFQCFVDDARLTIGRDPGSDVVVDDPAASPAHAAAIATKRRSRTVLLFIEASIGPRRQVDTTAAANPSSVQTRTSR